MARRGRRAAHEEEMRAVLERWERSGRALWRFADREGINRKTLYRWRRRLGVGSDRVRRGRRPESRENGVPAAKQSALFTEVSPAMARSCSAAVTFEVVLVDGTTVRVPDRFDPGSLRILLDTLGGC